MEQKINLNQNPKPKKKESPDSTIQELKLNSSKIFSEVKGEIFIGGEKIKPEIRAILKEQAKYLETSNLWEILQTTILNEANNLALKKSNKWDDILYAKALYYWGDFFLIMINKLKKQVIFDRTCVGGIIMVNLGRQEI